jgi:Subtilase family
MRINLFTRMRSQAQPERTDGGLALAISWGDSGPKKLFLGMLALVSMLALTLPPVPTRAAEAPSVSLIVRPLEGAGREVGEAIRALGGEVVRRLGIIESLEVDLPQDRVASLASMPEVASVTSNASIELLDHRDDDDDRYWGDDDRDRDDDDRDREDDDDRRDRDDDDDRRDRDDDDRRDRDDDEDDDRRDRDDDRDRDRDDDRDDREDDRDSYDPEDDASSMYSIAQEITGATEFWRDGLTGDGVGVAMIDSGVAPVDGLLTRGKVVNGVDLSFESQSRFLRHLDTFGHGTHMAGIIAGRDYRAPSQIRRASSRHFLGMAPDAHLINVKVADHEGATDVSQVIAAIDWVVQHRNDENLNIRVLNLSFGTNGVQDYQLDPLAHAAEVAWRKGVVVVVAAGNGGYGSAKLNNPAYDPYVMAVGAADGNGTSSTSDDTIPEFSSCGNAQRRPDLVAPGKSVVSLRSFLSSADRNFPGGRVGSRFFRGSGTSQAAAVVSGAAALLIQQRPSITPDQVKALMMSTANGLPEASPACQGAGMLDMGELKDRPTPDAVQNHPVSTGLGSLDAARGSARVSDDGVDLEGEIDIFGNPWDAKSWSAKSWSGTSWNGGTWNGKSWSGSSWSGKSWSGKSWSATEWQQDSWSGSGWLDDSWHGFWWSGKSWSGKSWSGKSWSGKSWSSKSWSGKSWSSNHWDD